MTPETKLAIAALAVWFVGVALIAYGLGSTSKLAAVGTGIVAVVSGFSLFALIWRGRA